MTSRLLKNIVTAAFVVVIAIAGLTLTTSVVKADPHGVFYTAIGQKQLFFNVLAALDQADYVEYEYERQDRVDDREAVAAEPPFEDEEFELLEATSADEGGVSDTDPGSADLLSRSITLEGNDLYNDQLIRGYGAEFSRRNGMSELVRSLCEFGLGVAYCDPNLVDLGKLSEDEIAQLIAQVCADNPGLVSGPDMDPMCIGNPKEMSDDTLISYIKVSLGILQGETYINNPLKWGSLPVEGGILGAAESNKHVEDGATMRNVDLPDRIERLGMGADFGLVGEPYAYSGLIASWRQDLVNEYDDNGGFDNRANWNYDDWKWRYDSLELLIENAVKSLIGSTPAPNPYKGGGDSAPIGYVNGELTPYPNNIYDGSPTGRLPNARELMLVTDRLTMGYERIRRQLEGAETRVAAQMAAVEDEGVFAEAKVNARNREIPTELFYDISRPVAVREADIYSLPINLGLLDTSQRVSSLAGIDTPGNFQLVVRKDRDEETGSPGSAAGIMNRVSVDNANGVGLVAGSMNGALEGRVLGDLNLFGTIPFTDLQKLFMMDYDEARPPTSPSARIIVGHLEQGAVHALRAITGGLFRKAAGDGGGGGGAAAASCGMTGC